MYGVELSVDKTKGVPTSAHDAFMEAYLEARARELEDGRKYVERARQDRDVYLAQVRGVIGDRNLARYTAYRRDYRRAIQAARKKAEKRLPHGQGFEEWQRERRALREKADAFFKSLKVDTGKIRQLQREFRSKRETLYEATIGRAIDATEPLRRRKNQTFVPPFSGSWTRTWNVQWKGDPTDDWTWPGWGQAIVLSADRNTGIIHARSGLGVEDASDYDEWNTDLRTAVTQWYRMEGTGRVRVRVKGQLSHHRHGYMENEWGVSSVSLRKRIRLWAQVWSPTTTDFVILSNVYHHVDTNEDDHSWQVQSTFPVDLGPVNLPGTFSQNTWVRVATGAWVQHFMLVDDVEVESSLMAELAVTEFRISVG